MKILFLGNFGHGWDGSICDEEHIATALEALGHEVMRWQREEPSFGGGRLKPMDPPDFTLVAQWDGYRDDLVKFLPKPIVYWAFDHQDRSQKWHIDLANNADLYLSKRLSDGEYFENWRWLSQDFYPHFLRRPIGYRDKDIDVLFTGTYLPWATERNETLNAIENAFGLTIHSVTPTAWIDAGFKEVHGPVMDELLPDLIDRAKINISIDHTHEAGYWSDRTAQIMACGGFTLMRHTPLAEARFQCGLDFFYNTGHALTLIGQYLEDASLRQRIADEGYEYAQQYLGVESRVGDLLVLVKELL